MLYKRFRRLDRSGRGTLSNDDLQMIPEIAMNPLSSRLQVLFEKDGEDRINFKSFVSALAIFSEKSLPELKCRGQCPASSTAGEEEAPPRPAVCMQRYPPSALTPRLCSALLCACRPPATGHPPARSRLPAV